jgi:hypothetical protein
MGMVGVTFYFGTGLGKGNPIGGGSVGFMLYCSILCSARCRGFLLIRGAETQELINV